MTEPAEPQGNLPPETWDFVERFALLLERDGIPRIAGRVLGYLLVCEPSQQTARDLRDALGASKGSISTMTRLLVRVGMIQEVPLPGQRTTAFQFPAEGVDRLFQDAVQSIHLLRETLESGLGLVEQQDPAGRWRLEELAGLYRFLDAELPVLLARYRAGAVKDGG